MIRLYVAPASSPSSLVELDVPHTEGSPFLSYKYELESDDLSSFTVPYSTSINLPKTHTNLKAFNFPDHVGYRSATVVDNFVYSLTDSSSSFTDNGKVVISSVSDTININLFSGISAFNAAISNASYPSFTEAEYQSSDFLKKADGTNSGIKPNTTFTPASYTLGHYLTYDHTQFWNNNSVSGSYNCFTSNNAQSTNGVFHYGFANFGCTSDNDFDNGTFAKLGTKGIGESEASVSPCPIMSAPRCQSDSEIPTTASPIQLRWYQLRIVVPVLTILNNIKYKSGDTSYTLNVSSSVAKRLNDVFYVGPTIGDISTKATVSWSFTAEDIFKKLEKPWTILKRVFKEYNVRLVPGSSSTIIDVVLTDEFYGLSAANPYNATDLSGSSNSKPYLDYTDASVTPYAFKNSNVIFNGEAVETSSLKKYKTATGYEYNRGSYFTQYPIKSDKKWFSDPQKYGISLADYPYTIYKYWDKLWDSTYHLNNVIEAFDDDNNSVDISGVLVKKPSTSINTWILGDHNRKDSYTEFEAYKGYYSTHQGLNTIKVHATCVDVTTPFVVPCLDALTNMYGGPKYYISGSSYTNHTNLYFKDVVDAFTSSLKTIKVCWDLLSPTSINTIVRKVYWFDNQYWVIHDINGYVPGSYDYCTTTFLRINNLASYVGFGQFSNAITGSHGSVSVTVNGSAVATPSSFSTVIDDQVVATFTASSGYAVTSYSLNGITTSVSPSQSLVLKYTSDKNVALVFNTSPAYTITASAGSGGSVSPASTSVVSGGSITLTAAPNTNYRVYSWTDNGTTTVTDSTTLSISNITANHTVSVAFVSSQCQLTVAAYDGIAHITGQGGTVAIEEGGEISSYEATKSLTRDYKTSIKLRNRAASGYKFVWWEDTNGTYISSTEVLDFTFTQNAYSIRAVFEPTGTVRYPLILTSGTGIGNTYGTGSYAQGTQVSINCDVDAGYTFDDWYDEGTALHLQQSDTYEMPAATKTLQARANPSGKYVLKFSGVNCSVSQSEVEVTPGQSVTITVTPSTGYSWGSWNDGNTDNPRTFRPIASASYTATCWEPRSYTYRFFASTGGQVSQSELIGLSGTSATITASVTDSDYEFDRWDDDTTTPRTYGASRLFTIGNHSQDFVALFKRVRSSVTITSDDIEHCEFSLSEEGPWYTTLILNGTIGTSSNSVYSSLTNHYYISDWDDGEPVVEPRTFEFLDVDSVVTAHIQEDLKWTLFFTVDGPGEVSQSSYRGYTGSTVTVTATSQDDDYDFDCWTDMPTVHNNPTRQFTVGSSDRTYTARFKRVRSSITVTSDDPTHARFYTSGGTHRTSLTFNGTIGTSTADVYYDLDYHYYISAWDDGESTEEESRTFTFQDVDTVVTANIAEDSKWTLSFEVMGSGAVGGQVSPTSYHGYTNDTVSVTASSKTGSLFPTGKYVFDHWSDLPSTDPSYASATRTFTVGSNNKTYYAVFRQAKVTLTFNATNGSCSPSSALVDINSTSPSVTCTPNTNYRFKQWDDGSTSSTRTFKAMLTDRTYTATCVYDESDVSLVVSPPLAGTTTGAGTYAKNDSVTITATANDGYEFKYWWDLISAKYASASNPYQFTMGSSDRAFEARFESAEPILRPIYIQGSGTVSVTVNGVEVDPTVSHTLESGDVVNVLAVPSGSADNVVWSFTGHTPYSGWLNDTALSWDTSTYASAGYCVPPAFPATGSDNFTYRWGHVTSMDGFILQLGSGQEGLWSYQPSTAIEETTFTAYNICHYIRPTFKTANRDTSYVKDNTTGRYVVGGIRSKGYTFEITGPVTITATFDDYMDYPLVLSRNTNE